MTLSKTLLAGAVAVLAVTSGPAMAANLIVNGDFEASPSPANGGYLQYFGGQTVTGWTVTGADILLIDRNYNEDTLVFNANSPNVAVDLTGAGNTSPLDGLFQDVATQGGGGYTLSFAVGNAGPYGSNGGNYTLPSTARLTVLSGADANNLSTVYSGAFTNSDLSGVPSAGISWRTFNTNFTATGAVTRIHFYNGDGNDNYVGLDDVSLAAVPEPSTWAMMLVGFGALGAVLRRRRTYRLVEIDADSRTSSETFRADDDETALARALDVAEGVALELWRDDTLVKRCDLSGLKAA